MRAHHSIHRGSRFRTGSHFVLAVLLTALVMLGMLAMSGISAGSAAAMQSPTASGPAMQGDAGTAPAANPQQAGSASVRTATTAAHAMEHPPAAAAVPCANCSTDELSMAANCGAVVVPGPLLQPTDRTPGTARPVRAGPQALAGECVPVPRPSLTLLCINRC